MADPLQRSKAEKEEKAGPWYRGFHAAQMRKPIIAGNEPSMFGMIISGMLTALPVVGFFYLQLRSKHMMHMPLSKKKKSSMDDMQKAFQSFSDPTGNKNFRVEVKDTKFQDVIGVPEALVDVKQYVDFLKNPEKFTRLGGHLPKGCLLTGEPGTGKTLLAKAVAGEADVPFFACSGADFIEVYVGSGPKRIRELFEAARATTPSVVFMDEIDALGSRGGKQGAGGVNQEENRTINQLLAEMDGLSSSDAIVVFAATNFQEALDKALLREGRFDRKVDIPMPDLPARTELFQHFLGKIITGDPKGCLLLPTKPPLKEGEKPAEQKKENEPAEEPITPDPSISNEKIAEELAGLTPGLAPSTIATIVNEAALAAALDGEKYVKMKHLRPAIDDVVVGKKQRNRMTKEASSRVALHEAGHALTAWMLPQQSNVIKLSITPRGRAAGFTQQLGREVLDSVTDRMLFTDICVMLGGRCAELMQYHDLTTGAQDDLQRATKNALNQFLAFGMSPRMGLLSFDYNRMDSGRMYQTNSERTQYEAELEAGKLVDAAFNLTKAILDENKDKLLDLTTKLIDKREIVESEIETILGPRKCDPTAPLPALGEEALAKFFDTATTAAVRPQHLDEKKPPKKPKSGASTVAA